MEPTFVILKRLDLANFGWLEVVHDLQTAEARIQKLQACSPGEYVVFSERARQIVAMVNSPMAGAGAGIWKNELGNARESRYGPAKISQQNTDSS